LKLTTHQSHSLKGEFSTKSIPGIPGDKSISHRAALMAGMARGESRIHNFMDSGVTKVMLDALRQLGVEWRLNENVLIVRSEGFRDWNTPQQVLYCGNSATTMRLLAGAVAAAGVPAVLDGSESLRSRPMDRIISPLQSMGVPIKGSASNTAPLVISPRNPSAPLSGIEYTLPVSSAQVKTCLLLASLAADGSTTLRESPMSRDHTERMLEWLGVPIENSFDANSHTVHMYPIRSGTLPSFELVVPGDFSSAAFLIVAGLITPGSEIVLKNIGLNHTRTGMLDVLQLMGANIATSITSTSPEPEGDIRIKSSDLVGITIGSEMVVRMIDEFPIFSIAALKSSGYTKVYDAIELRYKETDRISSLCSELSIIGASVSEHSDGFSILGSKEIQGGTVDPHSDHRLAMSLAVAGLISTMGVTVNSAEIINESFPSFFDALNAAGAKIHCSDPGQD
jgi:3-phosphoshikimate 1-carboxyvinyltransferase